MLPRVQLRARVRCDSTSRADCSTDLKEPELERLMATGIFFSCSPLRSASVKDKVSRPFARKWLTSPATPWKEESRWHWRPLLVREQISPLHTTTTWHFVGIASRLLKG